MPTAAGFAGCSRLRRLPPAGAGWRRRRDARGLISGLAGGSAARLADHKTYFPTSPDRLPADFMAQGGRGRQPPRRQARPRLTPRLTLRRRAPPHLPLHPFNTLPSARNREAEMGSLDHVCSRHLLIKATLMMTRVCSSKHVFRINIRRPNNFLTSIQTGTAFVRKLFAAVLN